MMAYRCALLLLLLVLLLALPSANAAAEGPGTGGRAIRLDNEPAGPYLMRVVTSPTPPRIQSLFLEIRVVLASDGELVQDAEVYATAALTDGAARSLYERATHDFAPIPGEYAVHLPVEAAGIWDIGVLVQGAQGSGEVHFLQRVSSPATLGAALSVLLPILGLAGLIFVFLRLQRSRPHP